MAPDHPTTALALNGYANFLKQLKEYDEAESLHRRVIAIREKALGKNHPELAGSYNNLGLVQVGKGEAEKALVNFRQSAAILEAHYGADFHQIAIPLVNIAESLETAGQFAEAAPVYRRVIDLREVSRGVDHSSLIMPLHHLGRIELAFGRPAVAETLLRRAQKIAPAAGPNHEPDVLGVHLTLGRCLVALGDWEGAETEFTLAREGAEEYPEIRAEAIKELAEKPKSR